MASLDLAKVKQLVAEKKKESSRTVLGDLSDGIFGPVDKDSTLPATIARRMSDSVFSYTWWMDTLSIDDGSGDVGDNESSWDMQVYFDPSKAGNLKLVDFKDDEHDPMVMRERARQLYKKRAYSDNLYRGRGTVPIGSSGGVRVKNVSAYQDEHPPEPRFAPADILSTLPTMSEERARRKKEIRKQRKASYASTNSGTSYTSNTSSYDSRGSFSSQGSSFTESVASSDMSSDMSGSVGRPAETGHITRQDSAFINGNPKLKELFSRHDNKTGMIKLADLDRIAIELKVNANQLAKLRAAVETDGDNIDFATFEAMLLPFTQDAY